MSIAATLERAATTASAYYATRAGGCGLFVPKPSPCPATLRRWALRMAQAPHLTVTFPGKTIGIYRKDGAKRGVLRRLRRLGVRTIT